MIDTISAIVSITDECNLACAYCYATNRSGLPTKKRIMSNTTLQNIICQIVSTKKKRVLFFWHGGEPLLAGKTFFEKIIEIQKEYGLKDQVIINTVQTNAVMVDSAWAKFFSKNNFRIGVSLDGSKIQHDENRKFRSGKGSFEYVTRGINLLIEEKIPLGFLVVITRNNLNNVNELFDFFQNNEFNYYDIVPYVEFNQSTHEILPNSVSPSEFGEFLIKLYKLWFKSGNLDTHIRYFENVLAGLFGGQQSSCIFNNLCSKQISFAWNGDIYHCDWFIGKTEKCFGNINNESLHQIQSKISYQNYIATLSVGNPVCLACSWYAICNGGCAYHREIVGGFDSNYYFCDSRKMLYSYILTTPSYAL